jgi:hypothetical protein
VFAQTSDPAQRAEAHLYHALATAVCGGPEAAAAAELDAVRAQADLLSPESRATLDQVGANVPTSVFELRAVLAPAEENP